MALLQIVSMWGIQFSLESSVTPRYLTVVSSVSVCPSMRKGLSRVHLRFLVNIIVVVLTVLNLTPIVLHHLLMMLR